MRRSILDDGRVAISIVDRDQPFAMASVRGHVARRVEGDAAWVLVDRIARKYIDAPYSRDDARVVYVIAATQVVAPGVA